MYYLIRQKDLISIYCKLATLLIVSISIFTFQTKIFADILDQTAEEYRIRGYEQQKKGDFKGALDFYSKALNLGVSTAILFNDLGVVYEQLGLGEKAEYYYLKAVALDENYLPAYTNLAYLYLDRGDQQKAVELFKERLSRSPIDDPWRDKILEELFRLNPEYKKQITAQKAWALNKELAEKAYQEFLLQVMRSEKHYERGQGFLSEGRFKEAVTEFDRALAVTPGNPKVLKAKESVIFEEQLAEMKQRTQRAMEDLEAKNLESAKEEFQKILAIIPDESVQKSK